MKIQNVIMMTFLALFLGCTASPTSESTGIEDEIKKLESIEAKRSYLEQIFEDDQKVRGSEGSEIMLQYGKDSEEHINYIKAQMRQDDLNLIKIETYLQIHGYPSKEMGETATTIPWMVIHHAQGYEARERNFEQVYLAYLNGHIDEGAITFYLGRMYEMRNGTRLEMESPYTSEDEIKQLIKALNLEEKRANALKAKGAS